MSEHSPPPTTTVKKFTHDGECNCHACQLARLHSQLVALTAELQSLKKEFQDFQASYTDLLQLYNETCEELELARKWMESVDYDIIIEGLIYACNTRHYPRDNLLLNYPFYGRTDTHRPINNEVWRWGLRACFYSPTDESSDGVVTNTPASYFKHIAARLRGLDCVNCRPYQPHRLAGTIPYRERIAWQGPKYPIIQTPQGTMKLLDYCSENRWDLW